MKGPSVAHFRADTASPHRDKIRSLLKPFCQIQEKTRTKHRRMTCPDSGQPIWRKRMKAEIQLHLPSDRLSASLTLLLHQFFRCVFLSTCSTHSRSQQSSFFPNGTLPVRWAAFWNQSYPIDTRSSYKKISLFVWLFSSTSNIIGRSARQTLACVRQTQETPAGNSLQTSQRLAFTSLQANLRTLLTAKQRRSVLLRAFTNLLQFQVTVKSYEYCMHLCMFPGFKWQSISLHRAQSLYNRMRSESPHTNAGTVC
jgi:predicted secreted protein